MNTNHPHPVRALVLMCIAAAFAFAATACRGGISTSPPVHLVPDMDFQAKYKAQAASKFFADGRTMRKPPAGTIPHAYTYTGDGAQPDEDSVAETEQKAQLQAWKDASGKFLTSNPLEPSTEVLARGAERYGIYCAVCHGMTGRGGNKDIANSPVGQRWPVPIPSFIDDERVRQISDGEIFNAITIGINTMPSYAHMVSVEDRWSIIHYIRALQYQAENQ